MPKRDKPRANAPNPKPPHDKNAPKRDKPRAKQLQLTDHSRTAQSQAKGEKRAATRSPPMQRDAQRSELQPLKANRRLD